MTNTIIPFEIMRKITLFLLALFIVSIGYTQSINPYQTSSVVDLFEEQSVRSSASEVDQVTEGTLFSLNQVAMQGLRTAAPSSFTLEIPIEHGENLVLILNQVEIFSSDFVLQTSGGEDLSNVDLGVHYRGTIQGEESSSVAISVFADQIRGVAVAGSDNYNLGPIELGSTEYICYKSVNLSEEIKSQLNYTCGSVETGTDVYTEDELNFAERGLGDVVRIRVEVDRSIYLAQGSSSSAATAYATSLVNQNAAIYFQEGIGTVASAIFVWTTTDPYDGVNGCSTDIRQKYLCDFQAQFAGFSADLAILLLNENIGGYAASFDGLCNANPDNSMCIAGQSGTVVSTFPVYSYNTYIFAHELGHLFGSRHTHACVWNGNNTAIDGCSATEGGCALPPIPASGNASVMSYCQAQLAGGYISNAPFGTAPGNVIRASVAGASCIGCASPTIYIPTTISAGPAIYLCPDELAPVGYVRAASQSCAQTVINNDPFCLGSTGGVWDIWCSDAYNACIEPCSIYLPNATINGPGIYVCPGEPIPSGYVLAVDQACAASVLASDAYCVSNSWDDICNAEYYSCIAGCTSTTYYIYLPQVGVSGPAELVCAGDPAPVGYFEAANQSCAQQIIEDDTYCLTNTWDATCRNAYNTCVYGCPTYQIYIPVVVSSGPAIILCPGEPVPSGYQLANQNCAQFVINSDPFCLQTLWDGTCQSAYSSCCGGTTIYLPNAVGSGPAIIQCNLSPAPTGYTAASNQACAQTVIDNDSYCLTNFWDSACQNAYNSCSAPGCQSPSNLDVVEITFGGSNPRVNATWTNPEGTSYCEVRGGRISNASYASGEPEFVNLANTQVITSTNGSTVNFNIALYNNPNIPFIVGSRYGYDVRCMCADGSGMSEWANITPEATFVVPGAPAGVEVATSKLLDAGMYAMTVFPNPAEDMVNIQIELAEEGSVELILQNALGQTVAQQRASGISMTHAMDVSSLESGIYMLSVRTATGVITERLIVK